MVDLTHINREFERLDTALRGGQLDRVQFRAERRKLLLDFDERASTTTPGATQGSEITRVDPPFELPAPAPDTPTPVERAAPPLAMLVMLGSAALVVLALGGWWLLGREPGAPPAAMAVAATPASSEPPAVSELPQDVANTLIQSAWTDADLNSFLQRWSRLPPDAVRAATDDPLIWLLRGQTEQRLRDAREAESVNPSEPAQARTQQLGQVHAAIH